jgi:hypothetical protein
MNEDTPFTMELSWYLRTPSGASLRVGYAGTVSDADMNFIEDVMNIIKETVACGRASLPVNEERSDDGDQQGTGEA